MAYGARRFCRVVGCPDMAMLGSAYCEAHKGEEAEAERRRDARRCGSRERGYSSRWDKYSKAFLHAPGNQFCALHLDAGCAVVAQCVDHIDPPEDARDPKFWDKNNHQPACIHCNSVKGHRKIVGSWSLG